MATMASQPLIFCSFGVQASRESDSSEQPCSARLSDCCSDQSSVTSMSLNASIDFTNAAAAVAASNSYGDGDAVPPLLAPPAQPSAKKAPQGATELYAFALAAPRLDAAPSTGEQPILAHMLWARFAGTARHNHRGAEQHIVIQSQPDAGVICYSVNQCAHSQHVGSPSGNPMHGQTCKSA